MAAVPSPPRTADDRPGFWALLRGNTLASAGLVVLGAIVLLAVAAPWLPLQNPDATAPAERLLPAFSEGHWLGTDALGRDLLSRTIWGSRVSLAVGVSATLIAACVGSLIGLVAGYAGGRVDAVLMRSIDMVMAFPYILLALAIVAVLGPGLLNALYAIAVVNIPFFARNIRGITLGLSRREFVDAARLSGRSHAGILFGEILPNVMPIIIITMSTTVGWMILETAGLSFLGLGAQPPQADLGSMLGEGRKTLFTAAHVSVIPGVVIFLLVMSINLIGDGLRDVLDPRLRSGALSRPKARTEMALRRHAQGNATTATAKFEASDSPVLDLHDLHTCFRIGPRIYHAVGGVDLVVGQGECLGIVGESGSGKSVTALSIMGLVPTPPGRIVRGSARFNESGRNAESRVAADAGPATDSLAAADVRMNTGTIIDLFRIDNAHLQRLRGGAVAYVFQDPLSTLHPLQTVGDQLIEAVRTHQAVSHRQAKATAIELLNRVRFPNPAERLGAYPHELSGGMRQRVCIAMALANDAQLLICDEPTTALDVTVQAQILNLLKTQQRESRTAILFITHDFGVVSALCDRVAVMYAGQIVESGPTQDLLDAPRHPYTTRLIECVPILGQAPRQLQAIQGRPPEMDNLPPGCAFAERCDRATEACRIAPIPLQPDGPERQVRCLHPMPYRQSPDQTSHMPSQQPSHRPANPTAHG